MSAVAITVFPMARGATYDRHTHGRHQLAWASTGILFVSAQDTTWVLPPSRALWIPAHLPHEVRAADGAEMTAAYFQAERCSLTWPVPTPVRVGGLVRELIVHLGVGALDVHQRSRAEAVLIDVLHPVPVAGIEVRLPIDPRALDVATMLRDDPADRSTLAEWGGRVGASERTLARAFIADTGIPFGRWRTLARLQAAIPLLAANQAVGTVAHVVGYETPSAFVAAFRQHVGQTPGAYFGTKTGATLPGTALAR